MSFAPGSISHDLMQFLAPYAEFAFLLGSAETDRFNQQSDIDVAVFWKDFVTPEQIISWHRLLEDQLKRDLDLVSLNRVDVIFARQVLETGRLLFCNSAGILLNWKMEQLSTYPDFKVSRKIVEENILNRKKYV